MDPRICLSGICSSGWCPGSERCGALLADLHFRCTDHAGGPDRAAGAVSVLHRCVLSDRISVHCGVVLRRNTGDDRASSDHDAESRSCVSCIDHGILRTRSGPSGEWHALVRLSGAALFQYFLCVPDPAVLMKSSRISCSPTGCGQSALKKGAGRQDPVSGVSDQDDHSGILSVMLNTAKRSRTTVERLELRGYRHSIQNPEVKK